MDQQRVAVIGLGVMGQAIAGALLAAGRDVAVWNRSAGRADDLVARGAELAATAAEAVSGARVVLVSLTDYDAMYDALGPASGLLDGRAVVNLSSGTPEQARTAAGWAAGHGAQFLAGGVRVPPSGIGDASGVTYYAGPEHVFAAWRDVLAVLTTPDYRGPDPGLALLYYQLEESLLWGAMTGYLQAVALAEAHGVPARELQPLATGTMSAVQELLAFYGPRIDAGDHGGDADRLETGAANVAHLVRGAEEAGVDTTLPAALHAIFARGLSAGHADRSATSLVETLKAPVA